MNIKIHQKSKCLVGKVNVLQRVEKKLENAGFYLEQKVFAKILGKFSLNTVCTVEKDPVLHIIRFFHLCIFWRYY